MEDDRRNRLSHTDQVLPLAALLNSAAGCCYFGNFLAALVASLTIRAAQLCNSLSQQEPF
jgi:hypothetical protein